jgi:hypothetical protein
MYDYTDKEIVSKFVNNEYIDMSLYYRLFEYHFDINIFLFHNFENMSDSKNIKTPKMLIPRHKYFHIHNYDERNPSIILYLHTGSDKDIVSYPHCEYIKIPYGASLFDISEIQYVISPEVTKNINVEMGIILYDTMTEIVKNITYHNNMLHSNMFNRFDPVTMFTLDRFALYGQIIDDTGKGRGFIIYDTVTKTFLSIYTYPTAPIYIKNSRVKNYRRFKRSLSDNNLPHIKNILPLFNFYPSAKVMKDDLIIGLWFPIFDIKLSLYIPIKPIHIDEIKYDDKISKMLYKLDMADELRLFGIEINNNTMVMPNINYVMMMIIVWLFKGVNLDDDDYHNYMSDYISDDDINYRSILATVLSEDEDDDMEYIEKLQYIEDNTTGIIKNGKLLTPKNINIIRYTNQIQYIIKIGKNSQNIKNLLDKAVSSNITRIKILKNIRYTLLQIIQWLYDNYIIHNYSGRYTYLDMAESFIEEYIDFDSEYDSKVDSINVYDFILLKKVKYVLPLVDDMKDAFDYIRKYTFGIVDSVKNVIYCYNNIMKEGISYFIRSYSKQIIGKKVVPIQLIEKQYEYVSDFKYHEYFDAENQILIADIGHYESEIFTKDLIYEYLTQKFSNIAAYLSEVSTNPIKYFK